MELFSESSECKVKTVSVILILSKLFFCNIISCFIFEKTLLSDGRFIYTSRTVNK